MAERLTEAARYGLAETFHLSAEEAGKRVDALLNPAVRLSDPSDPQEAKRQVVIRGLAKDVFQHELNKLANLFPAEIPQDPTECLDRSELINFETIERQRLRHLSHCLICIWRLMKMPPDLCRYFK